MNLPDRPPALEAIEVAIWRELRCASDDRHHEWRTPVLASVDAALGADARTVVLREVDADAKQLRLYTDARSAKAAQIAAEPRVTLLCWSPRLQWQLRLRGRAGLVLDESMLRSRWERLRDSAAASDYLSPRPPGSVLAGATDPPGTEAHFAIIELQVDAIDWLELHRAGHRRALFDGDGARWLQP
ncbi:pyridoxamine 5'-phosphate oxidase family protein [Rivibacter subsaxonicus]|uniref:Pyridoxamine 5'-phosphate oxidase n=1 Tax=Rivibacter subsaxonicus TaxID=457575 RepID=A0A4Q7VGQ2_9BURK|nr:pyridoxamine 5'-phosphate oxidase family protein [Rivibacter subsaxonicus]RZT95226.1 pyridoxamine 5'-phosphate oxidase [Rivibacter subsaxonicus]